MSNFGKYKEKGMLFDSLEHEYDSILRPDLQIIIRLDGISFTSKFLKLFNKATYSIYQECMKKVTFELCAMFKSTKIAYTHTDEINLILSGKDVESNDFNRVQKILTKASSLSSALLTQYLSEKLNIDKNLSFNGLEKCSCFSAKVHNLP
ncbi:MAG: tRNA(His) guanylyltransferase Thg1 family protein, partial [Bacillota bacterium]